jgi:hypothetical protein
MRHYVLVEVFKPSFAWVEIEGNHPLDCIEPAIEAARKLPVGAFVDAADLDPVVGLQGCDEIEEPVVLAVADDTGVIHYTRSQELDALHEIEKGLG